MTTTIRKIDITDTERFEVMKKACLLSNIQLNEKVNVLLEKIRNSSATDRERREAVILAQVIINRTTQR